MARFIEPTPEEKKVWEEWVASRPDKVRAVAERFDPWSLYRLKSTGQRVTVQTFTEHLNGGVTLTVAVSGDFNRVMFSRSVFGINPDDLEPCELPEADERTGETMASEEADAFVSAMRSVIGKHTKEGQ